MGKYYTQTTAALNAVTIDTAKLDAQNILIYPGEGDRQSRINVAESLKSVSNSIEEIHELLENVGPSDDCALKSADNTFTGTNTFSSQSTVNVKGPLYVDGHPDAKPHQLGFSGTTGLAITSEGIKTRMPVTIIAEGGELPHYAPSLNVLPLGKKTALGADAYAIQASFSGGLQLWGTHFMQGDEWSDNALKVVHNELALFGNHQAPCSLTFDNANTVNFRVMPDDGSTANGGQGAIFDFQGWQWDNNDHTSKNANCPVQILKNNAGELVDRSLLNKSELDARYAQLHSENTLTETNTFEKTIIAEDGINATSGDIVVTEGVITFEDLIDGTVVERSGATGYQYVEGIPTSFENGVCYDIGEISNTTNLTNVKFTGEGRLVQTCELWFTTPATVPTAHQWPANTYWIDSATGAAPALIASKNYRLVFRQEPNKIIASIAYLY